jgi:pyruvate dehydrogenase E1 component
LPVSEAELSDWLESLDALAAHCGHGAVTYVVNRLEARAREHGVQLRRRPTTPYVNTIGLDDQPPYPGNLDVEQRLRNIIRYNAMAMVVRANREHDGIGGHISTYASCATLFEVALNHFLRATDVAYFQGHASPGIYARAFVEGRFDRSDLERFRRETVGGLSSYPHPWLMPGFWTFPSVSMGLAPLMAIYQARFDRYLQSRGLVDVADRRVWCFMGDGESDEPEALAGASLAAREGLDNLIFVVNCNLQRLDGPVRGNDKIIQELEGRFAGAGWEVIKVIWGSDWDPLLARDDDGLLAERMMETVDGEYQRYVVASGAEIRKEFFGTHPRLEKLVAHLSDEQLERLSRGGHDPRKVHAAYARAIQTSGRPTVILAKTIKGYGLGEAGEGRNVTHQQKKLNHEELLAFRARFGIPIPDDRIDEAPFYRPDDDTPEIAYIRERREELGGWVPERREDDEPVEVPDLELLAELLEGSGDRSASTTMALVRIMTKLLHREGIQERIVPIIPDEARTFGMETLFRRYEIYAAGGQRYEPVDAGMLSAYRESSEGQILEEGISEAAAMASFIAAGTAYATHGRQMLPIYTFYSMFGFQRVGDLVWAAADSRARGFLVGATAGRTTLSGEGLQHQDGHSHLLASAVPTVRAYDPAYAYELAVIMHEGMRRMLGEQEPVMFYVTVYNEAYRMPPMPDGVREGIVRGMYPLASDDEPQVELMGSGTILREVLRARDILAERDVSSRVWSVTSWSELRRDALSAERQRRLRPDADVRSHLDQQLGEASRPFVAASDWVSLVPDQIARFLPGPVTVLGTDGFGRSDTRAALRRHFEVDAEHVAFAALAALHAGDTALLERARAELDIDPDAPDPAQA